MDRGGDVEVFKVTVIASECLPGYFPEREGN